MTQVIGTRPAAAPPPLIAVNGTIIPRAAITGEIQHHPAPSPSASWQKAAEALVLRELLLQEAGRLAIVATPQVDDKERRETDEEARIRALIEQEVTFPEPNDTELRRYYDANRARFQPSEILEARHILVAARASDADAFAKAREKAEALAAELAANPDAFDDLARAHSDCGSSGEGARLGQLTPEETTPEFAAAVADLAGGETTAAPVETRYGLHIIRLDRRIVGDVLPFDTVAARIGKYLRERTRRTATAQYLARLVSRAEITGIEIAGAEAHRVN
ncbi:peptidylprolyl isomerase [Bauldia litoralis]|uniref:peptidylprolyl isomerase n=1 Tax=Bauldia litoralis TaxID=665467 RepID=UPI003298637A